nr:DUF433 domain-containing protein [Actinomycetota bacterium]
MVATIRVAQWLHGALRVPTAQTGRAQGARSRVRCPSRPECSLRVHDEVALTDTLDDLRFTKPLYTVSEAASYLGVPRSTFATWMHGYVRSAPGTRSVHGEPLLTSIEGHGLTVPFIGLAEGMVLAAFRDTGLPLQRMRPALQRFAEEHELDQALASKHLYADGAEILYDYARAHGDKQLRLLTVVRTGQWFFHDVIERYLSRIQYVDEWAAGLTLPTTDEPILLADPERAFGQPVFVHGGARVADVKSRVEAGEPTQAVADDYGVPLDDVLAALASSSAAAAA